ncbi:MAG: hypothetical protein M0C28_13525 [Candidatus Moduliflexus flocculans]|nr:hypothetical protein [Candidatus Moduliflexus flocculans]
MRVDDHRAVVAGVDEVRVVAVAPSSPGSRRRAATARSSCRGRRSARRC